MKKYSICILVLSIILLLIRIVWPISSAEAYEAQFSIISVIHKWLDCLLYFGVAFFIVFLTTLFMQKKEMKCCTLKTTVISSGICVTFSLLTYCGLSFLLLNSNAHPIASPASLIVGIPCLAIFVILLILYTIERKKNYSKIGIYLDVGYVLLFWFPLITLYGTFYSILSDWISVYYDKLG